MIAIIDYDMGNLRSVSRAFQKVGARVCVTRDANQIRNSQKIVLPGVGAFPRCMENLKKYDLLEVISQEIQKGKWFLGICLGLQLLFERSEEHGGSKGLSIIKGRVVKFDTGLSDTAGCPYKIPHMGWNQIQKKGDPKLFKGIDDNTFFYFVHSYYVDPEKESVIATTTDYVSQFCSSIEVDNILACQFHPEKSQKVGLKVLENFVGLK